MTYKHRSQRRGNEFSLVGLFTPAGMTAKRRTALTDLPCCRTVKYMKQKIPTIDESRYRGEWLALDPKTYEVISHSSSFNTALAAARRKGFPKPLMHSVPQSDAYFVGALSLGE